MPEIVGRLRTPRLATAPGSPVVGEVYYDTATNALRWWNGTLWVSAGTSYGTSLPASPLDGQEAILVDSTTAATYRWCFRYNTGSSSTYKWEYVGGAALYAFSATSSSVPGPTGYADLTPTGPSVTAPRPGEYMIDFGAYVAPPVTGSVWISPYLGATALDADATGQAAGDATGASVNVHHSLKKTLTAATTVVKLQGWAPAGTRAGGAANLHLALTPVRVS